MSDTFKLAMQLTMIDMLSGVAQRARQHILSLGDAGKAVAHDFDLMQRHVTQGLKGIAYANYAINKIKPGVQSAADLQEAMIDVKMNLMDSSKSAKTLSDELATVRSTAVELQKIAPFAAKDVVDIENVFLKAGIKMKDVTAKGGAAFAATALATITKEAPTTIAEGMVSIAAPFNIKGEGYGELADFLQKVDTASITTVPLLVEGMKEVSGTAAQMKISWKDTAAALRVLSQNGLKGTAGGTALNDFLVRLTGTSHHARKVMAAMGLKFWTDQGKLRPMVDIIDLLRKKYGKLTDQQAQFAMQKVFEIQGARAAFALMHEGEGSWEAINASIKTTVSLQDKMAERMKGFSANITALQGTAKTSLANLFDPALDTLTKMTQVTNDLVDAVGRFSGEHKGLTATFDAMLGIGVAAAGGYGIYNLGKGAAHGRKVLSGLRGLSGTAMGVAEGKMVQEMTGVQPVFVTNFPLTLPAVPVVGGMVPTSVMLAPALLAAIVGAISITLAKSKTDEDVKNSSTQQLQKLRKQHMVLGGGPNTYQVQAIDRELASRGVKPEGPTPWTRGPDLMPSHRKFQLVTDMMPSHNPKDNATVEKDRLIDRLINGGGIKNDINLTIQVDGSGRTITRIDSMDTTVKTMKRGSFFEGI